MKKNKRLILHIGTIKTGTTTIQKSCWNSRDELLKHNIYYPKMLPNNHIYTFVPLFLENPEALKWFRKELKFQRFKDKDVKIQEFREAWEKEFVNCKPDQDFVISAEHLSGGKFPELAIERLKQFIERYFEQVTIIVYIRHYDSWIVSAVQQKIKNGYHKSNDILTIINRVMDCPPIMSYRRSLQKWINVFGRDALVVRPFDPRMFYKDNLLADFFHACSLPADDISIPEIRSNESIGFRAVMSLVKYNQMYPVFINNELNMERGWTRNGIPLKIYKNLGDEKFKPELIYSPKQARRLNAEIDYVNQFFEDGYTFPYVSVGNSGTQASNMDDIPDSFFVELINNCNYTVQGVTKLGKKGVPVKARRKAARAICPFLRAVER